MSSMWLALAFAFQPPTVDAGIEPHRVQKTHAQVQAQLQMSPDFLRWRRDAGIWQAQFDEVTRRPLAMWGEGVPMPHDEGALIERLSQVLQAHGSLFGTDAGELRLRSANYVDRVNTWYVDFDVLRDGLTTYRGGISARIKHGNLILLRVATAPEAPVTGALAIGEMEAVRRATAGGPAPYATHTDPQVEAMLLERRGVDGLQLRKVYQVTTRTKEPAGIWVAFVDGTTGEVLSVHNEVRFISGTVSGQHPARTVDGSAPIITPMPLIYVDDGNVADYADDDGNYSLPGNGTITSVLQGDYVEVYNAAGGEGIKTSTQGDFTWTTANATQAEISTYVFISEIRAWGESVAPEVGITGGSLQATVNIGDVCNAYYDGTLNFFSAGGGCNNTGQIADVVYHEWGHGFHFDSIQAGVFDGAIGEGAGDVTSFLQTHDNIMAPFFNTNGSGIRDVAPDQVYPNDFVNSADAVHFNGLIFGGAMWDLLELLQDAEGEAAGTQITADIFAGLLKGGPDTPSSVYEALVADDDDGNLANGTPHQCAIDEAFGRHGLGAGGIGTDFVAFHEPLPQVAPDVVNALRLETLASTAACVDFDNASGTLHYRVDGGNWSEAAAQAASGGLEGDLPALPLGTFVEYYFDGADGDNKQFTAPSKGIVAPYTTFVGDVIEVHCFDFESDDGGFTHELLSGTVSDGADDWQWGNPAGASLDPSNAFSGSKVWGNDLGNEVGGNQFNGEYQSDKVNRLTSPVLPMGHYTDVFLQYRRWLQVEDGQYDRARIYANDEEVWSNWDSAGGEDHHQDTLWLSHSVDLEGRGSMADLELAWELDSDGGLEFAGWTIDDVCVYAPATVDNRLAILDFEAEVDNQGFVYFSWTEPTMGPYTEVRVVRNDDRFPTDIDDGYVVWSNDEPELGGVGAGGDNNPQLSEGFYAIYTSDGTGWLSWTVEGWNATATDSSDFEDLDIRTRENPFGDDDDDDSEFEKLPPSGCGCTSSSTVGLWALLPLLGLLRRR